MSFIFEMHDDDDNDGVTGKCSVGLFRRMWRFCDDYDGKHKSYIIFHSLSPFIVV